MERMERSDPYPDQRLSLAARAYPRLMRGLRLTVLALSLVLALAAVAAIVTGNLFDWIADGHSRKQRPHARVASSLALAALVIWIAFGLARLRRWLEVGRVVADIRRETRRKRSNA
jgi:ABC-type proline/glycine betaine transport system permease subunit